MSSLSIGTSSIADTRKKQNKRDEAIRRKIESELSRKRTISLNHLSQRSKRSEKTNVAKGTVAALRPSPALTVPESITVSDASQLCAAKRTDCVLVVDEEEGLSGIFTAKDLAYRVTAEGLDPRSTPVSQIMTRSPMVTRDTTSATEALQLMVQRHFRHLPVCNEEGNVVGLLDITKVFHEALEKVERSSNASEKLYSALAGVQSELGPGMSANPQAAAMLAYVEGLREKTALPDLTTVMDSRTQPATVTPKTTVREAAKLMKERRTTAVCVMESPGGGVPARVAGIFTSKDVVLRVIAAGLDPNRCSVVRVMTPHPDTAPPTMTVQDALKKMHNGHYLNLPVMEEDGRLVAIVGVLNLTYATLEQMNSMSTDTGDTSGGPMWGRFFDSIGGAEDTESVLSGSHMHTDLHAPSTPHTDPHLKRLPESPEVHPNDSASVMDDDRASNVSFPPLRRAGTAASGPMGQLSSLGNPSVDDGTFVFKFKTPSGQTHRFQARYDNIETLHEIIAGKLEHDRFFSETRLSGGIESNAEKPNPHRFTLAYTDADGDTVVISSDADMSDAVAIARKAGMDRVVLIVDGGKAWNPSVEITPAAAAEPQEKVKESVSLEASTVGKADSTLSGSLTVPASSEVHFAPAAPSGRPAPVGDDVFGIPRDLLLPASIGALAVAVVGVFIISRLSSR